LREAPDRLTELAVAALEAADAPEAETPTMI
jgi:hypothetical protein